MSVAYIYHTDYLRHDTGMHPECPARLQAIETAIDYTRLRDKLEPVVPSDIADDALLAVHSRAHVEEIRQFCLRGGGQLSLDTTASTHSYRAARFAAGGAVEGVCRALSGQGTAFAAVRPPGHHATPGAAMGFCLFNNAAVGALAALNQGAERVFVFDWDVHHGNGTEQIMYDLDSVLYCSIHQYPAYPGTGAVTDVGRGQGEGFTVNIPVPPGAGDQALQAAMENIVAPIMRQYRPDIVICSAGFDSHHRDPLGGLNCSYAGWTDMMQALIETADQVCPGRIVIVLEGGYNLEVVGMGSALVLAALLGEQIDVPDDDAHSAPQTLWQPHIDRAREQAGLYWNLSL